MNVDIEKLTQEIQQKICARIYADVYGDKRIPTAANKVHVGDIVSGCLRRAFYSRMLPQTFFDLQTTINFWYGRIIHERPILKQQEMLLEWEGIIGHVDEYGDGVLIEKKSTSRMPTVPYAYHVRQAEYYKVLLEKNGHPVKAVFIVYFLKSLEAQLPLVLEAKSCRSSMIIANEMLHKRDVILECMKTGLIPMATYCADCNYCSYIKQCFGDEKR